MRSFRLLLAAIAALAGPAGALAAPCEAPEHRGFDFWLGVWDVHDAVTDKLAGSNAITREYDGCVIHERYTTGRGYSGESLNAYDAGRKVWHQTWVDSSGTVLVLEGGLRDGRMVLEGETRDGMAVTKHRITWTPNPDGSVRQLWESTDARGAWSTAFDGRYTRKR